MLNGRVTVEGVAVAKAALSSLHKQRSTFYFFYTWPVFEYNIHGKNYADNQKRVLETYKYLQLFNFAQFKSVQLIYLYIQE